MKSPAFQFYPSDYLASQRVQMMTLEEEGAYIRLLSSCWQHGTIPADPEQIARLIGKGASTTLATNLATMFQPSGIEGRLIHDRLEDERAKQAAWREKSAEGGRKSAEKRAANPTTTKKFKGGSRVVEAPLQPNGNQKATLLSSSSSSSSSTITKIPPLPPKVDEDGGENHVLPKNWKQLTITERKQTRVRANSKAMNRIGKFFGRRDGTLWSVAEAVSLQTVSPTQEEIQIVESYYLDDSLEKGSDYRRKDLSTLLNNWSGELDRARIFMTENGIKI